MPISVEDAMHYQSNIESLLATQARRLRALERFVRAHDAVEAGAINFDLQHVQVMELEVARKAIYWILPLDS